MSQGYCNPYLVYLCVWWYKKNESAQLQETLHPPTSRQHLTLHLKRVRIGFVALTPEALQKGEKPRARLFLAPPHFRLASCRVPTLN